MYKLTNVFKLLSDETRLRMLLLLYQEELCVCQLGGILDVPQPRISQNLGKLRDMDLVIDVRKEKYVYYSLKRDNQELVNILNDIVGDIDSYPKLINDRKGLENKEHYLKHCGTKCEQKEVKDLAQKWYPVIDYVDCFECGLCIEQCSHGVYDLAKAPEPIVRNPEACIDHCHGCGNLCPVGAITYVGDNTGWTPPKGKPAADEACCSCGGDCC